MSGKQLYRKDKVSNGILTISNLNFAEQVLLVKVVLENGHTATRKIIF
ncbi:T9SS sorting signal type C domain-containing protein [Flavobacterium piscis]